MKKKFSLLNNSRLLMESVFMKFSYLSPSAFVIVVYHLCAVEATASALTTNDNDTRILCHRRILHDGIKKLFINSDYDLGLAFVPICRPKCN